MRKFTIFALCISVMLTLLCLGPLSAYADEPELNTPELEVIVSGPESAQEEVTSDEITSDQIDPDAEASEAPADIADAKGFAYYYSVIYGNIAKLFEEENLDTVITWGCSVLSVLVVTLLKGSVSRLKNKISGTLDSSTLKTDELVEGYNRNSQRLEELSALTKDLQDKLDQKTSIDAEINENVRSFAEMLFLVYNGSTTIPEGMKDVLRTKYARLERSLAEQGEGEGV